MNNKKLLKKETKELVYKKIGTALSDLTSGIKNKAFEKKLQKASSILAKDIAKAAKKTTPKKGKSKKIKSEKVPKAGKMNSVKMNNLPVASEVQTGSENIVP